MGHRLSKIYTRTGDQGTTGLGDGSRVAKDDLRIEAMGCLDELNSLVGSILCQTLPEEVRLALVDVQHDLFDLGGELSTPGYRAIKASHVEYLEQVLDRLNGTLSPLKEFILPGGSPAAAACHVARTVCRRAERRLVALGRATELPPDALRYVNRLSDLLFVMARYVNAAQQGNVP